MTIKIVRNSDGNCITFEGSSNPVYFNACLSGEVDANFPNRVNVVNDIATAQSADTIYEFFQIDYTEFRDADSNPFATAADTASYITSQGNVIAVDSASYKGAWDAASNSPELASGVNTDGQNGDFYFVSVAGNSTIDSTSSWRRGDKIVWNGTEWQKLQATSVIDGSTYSTLLNTQTSVFADGEASTADPDGAPGWYYRNTENQKINWYVYGDTATTANELGDLNAFYAVVTPKNTTSLPYFSVYTKFQGDGNDQSWYRSRINYLDETNLQTMVAGTKYLIHNGASSTILDAIDQSLPRISLGADPFTTVGPQGGNEELFLMALSTSSNYPEATHEFVVEKIGYVLGDHQAEYSLSAPPTTGASTFDQTPSSINFLLEATGTTVLANDGQQYSVNSLRALDNGDGTLDIVALPALQVVYDNLNHSNITIAGSAAGSNVGSTVNSLNALFTNLPLGAGGTYQPTYPVLDAVDITAETHNTITPTTTKSDGTTVHLYGQTSTANNADVVWSTETIDAAGEYYLVKIAGGGRFLIGLGSEVDGDRAELEALTGTATGGNSAIGLEWSQAFYDYGSYTAPWTVYGSSPGLSYGPGWSFYGNDPMMRYNTGVQNELDNNNGAPGLRDGALFKVGIDQNGYITCWYFDEGRTNDFIMTARSTTVTSAGNYFLVVKLWDGNNVMVELPQRSAIDPVAPVLNYRFIDSPDGSFDYPLFATQEEANYVDTQNGGIGESHDHVYADEPTYATWYMPETGSTMDGSSAPANTSEITYSQIPTNADSLYAPGAFSLADLTVDEGSVVNYQVAPQDAPYVVTVTGAPSSLVYSLKTLGGTAPAVTGDNVANPSDDYIITVTRSNDYGSTSTTFTLTVNNLTAPVVDTGDFTVDTGTIVAGVLQQNSLADLSFTLSEGERVIIPKQWVDAHVNPNNLDLAEKVFLGILKSSTSTTAITIGDFNACFRWEGASSTSAHYVRLNDQLGASTGNDTFYNTGSSLYDYAIELYNGDLYLIACNVNSINTEPAVAEGGSFSRTLLCGDLTDNGLSAPYTIKVGTYAGSEIDLDDALTSSEITKIDIPEPPVSPNPTSWTKALDFSGSSERAQQVGSGSNFNPMMMSGLSVTTSAPGSGGNTSSDTNARPWATTCVFKNNGNGSNQHIWNIGEGAGSTDDNIYLRTDGFNALYFGWGRQGSLNEYLIVTNLGTAAWYGAYIGFNGQRLSGSDATAANLASCFNIKLMFNNNNSWIMNPNPGSFGAGTWGTTGGRMDRDVTGSLTIGGRGANRSYHGKVASFVTTTLPRGSGMPDTTEILEMTTNPMGWLNDYKVGNSYRPSSANYNNANFALNDSTSSAATQVWLMGDGTSDSYAKIRNQVYPSDQNNTPLNMINMVSNDIQTVSINGLS